MSTRKEREASMTTRDERWSSMDKDDALLEKLVRQYQAFNRAEGKSPQTIQWYETSLRTFLQYLERSGIEPVLGNVDVHAAREYVLYLQQRPKYEDHPVSEAKGELLSPTTVQVYVRALKAFFNWLHREGYTGEHRLERLRMPKAPRKLVEPLSEAEVAALLAAIDHQTHWGSRDGTILLLFLDTGLRLSELTSLPMSDLHLEDGWLKVMGKGGKERVVPFGAAAQRALMKYIYHYRPDPVGEDRVFRTLDGRPMSAEAVKLVVRRLGDASGVTRVHPHLLRHTFALNYLVNGGDVFSLQQILGHTTLEMVRRYVNLASAHIVTQHQRFSPVDQLNLRQIRQATAMRGARRSMRVGPR